MQLLFMDAETTGLDPIIHVPWEVAAVRAEHTDDGRLVLRANAHKLIRLTDDELRHADPVALDVGRFWRRHANDTHATPGSAARAIDDLCDDRPHLVGAVPSFDDRRVGDLLRRCGITPRWHYHLVDIEAVIVGWMAGYQKAKLEGLTAAKPALLVEAWKSDDLSRAIGVDPDQFDRHTAMGDVRWCIAQYAAVFGLTVEEARP